MPSPRNEETTPSPNEEKCPICGGVLAAGQEHVCPVPEELLP